MTKQPSASDSTLLEEGAAFASLTGMQAPLRGASVQGSGLPREHFDVVVVGGGQAGLSVGYHLAKQGLSFVILDANDRIGDSWRKRWNSLRLFTPARFNGLAGMPFPAPPDSFPTKDEMAAYLESYAVRFGLPVRTRTPVRKLTRRDGRYLIECGEREIEADQVVVAMANYQYRKLPAFARELRPDIVQLHSSDYRSPDQLNPGGVLVVGVGNSGAEIALEVAGSGRATWLSGRETGHVPFRVDGFMARLFLTRLVLRFVFHRVLTVKTPPGRKVRSVALHRGAPLIRVKPHELEAAGVARVPRVTGVRDQRPLLDDGSVLDVANVIWSTGYRPGFEWIDLPVKDRDGEPVHQGGVARDLPGLYFVGLHFLYAMSSSMIHGVGRDAERIAGAVAARSREHQIRPPEEVSPR